MKNAEVFLVDTLNRLLRSIEITGTGMNYAGRKAIDYPAFEKRFLKKITFSEGPDPKGYYGVRLDFVVDGIPFVVDTWLKRAMVYDVNPKYVKNGKVEPMIYRLTNTKILNYLNLHYRDQFGFYLTKKYNTGSLTYTDHVCPKPTAEMWAALAKLGTPLRSA